MDTLFFFFLKYSDVKVNMCNVDISCFLFIKFKFGTVLLFLLTVCFCVLYPPEYR